MTPSLAKIDSPATAGVPDAAASLPTANAMVVDGVTGSIVNPSCQSSSTKTDECSHVKSASLQNAKNDTILAPLDVHVQHHPKEGTNSTLNSNDKKAQPSSKSSSGDIKESDKHQHAPQNAKSNETNETNTQEHESEASNPVNPGNPVNPMHETAEDIPPDELAFTVPPHFSPSNPFHRTLSEFDLSMRCTICCELFHAPVSISPCWHVFCSFCIRKHCKEGMTGMKRRALCPQCNQLVGTKPGRNDYEQAIQPNKQLEQQVDIYKKMRDDLRESLVRLDVLEKEKKTEWKAMKRAAKSGVDRAAKKEAEGASSGESGSSKESSEKGRKRGRSKKTADVGGLGDEVETHSPKRSCRRDVNIGASDDSDSDEDYDDTMDPTFGSSGKAVSKYPSSSQNQKHQQQQPAQKLQRKPQVSYHKMKKKQLQDLCRKEGLSTKGTDKDLEQRHSYYITLYNSECDSDHPRSVHELLEMIKKKEAGEKEEKAKAFQNGSRNHEGLMARLKTSIEAVNKDGSGGAAKPTSGDVKFDSMMNDNFKKMIADMRKKKAMEKESKEGVKEEKSLVAASPAFSREESSKENNESLINKSVADAKTSGFGGDGNSGKDVRMSPPKEMIGSEKIATLTDTVNASEQINLDGVKAPTNSARLRTNSSTPSKPKSRITSPKPKSHQPSYIARRSSPSNKPSIIGPWSCSCCTYENKKNVWAKAPCEMCGNIRPTSRANNNHFRSSPVISEPDSPASGGKPEEKDVISIEC